MSKGLQSPSPLVQHCTALALAKCLGKYIEVLRVFRDVENFLEEDEDGQWFKRRQDLEREIRRRVPEFQVIIGFSQQKLASQPSGDLALATRLILLAESAQRLLWLYHHCLPALVAEARFDVGKLLLGFEGNMHDKETLYPHFDFMIGLQIVKQLHILRLLEESDQFAWSGKPGACLLCTFLLFSDIFDSVLLHQLRTNSSQSAQYFRSFGHPISNNFTTEKDFVQQHPIPRGPRRGRSLA